MRDNNIDNLFKDKLSNEETEFNSAAWTNAENLLTKQVGKSAWFAKKTIPFVAIISLLTISCLFWFLNLNSTTNIAKNTQTTPVKSSTETLDIVKSKQKNTVKSKNNLPLMTAPNKEGKTNQQLADAPTVITTNTTKKIKLDNSSINKTTKKQKNQIDNSKNNNPPTNTATFHLKNPEKKATIVKEITLQTSSKMNITNEPIVTLLSTEAVATTESFSQPVKLPINDRGLSILRNIDVQIIAGGGVVWGARNPSDDSSVGIGYSPTAGINIGYIVNSDFSFDINLLYRIRTGLSGEPLPIPSTSLPTVAKSIRYLDIPFYLNYHSNRHSFQFGMQYSYLVATKTEPTRGADNNHTTTWGKNNYFKTTDLSAVVGYNYLLNEKLNLGARFNYGIFDITGSQPSSWETIDKNIHLNILLEYKISKY